MNKTTPEMREKSLANMRQQLASAGMTSEPEHLHTLTGAALARASMIRELRAQGMEPVK